jgi:hypothetical protein
VGVKPARGVPERFLSMGLGNRKRIEGVVEGSGEKSGDGAGEKEKEVKIETDVGAG